jgi:hypothetical protein
MNQIDKETVYNQIIQYFDFSQKLVESIDENITLSNKEFDEIDKIIFSLENKFDNLTLLYIEIFKNGYNDKLFQQIRDTLNDIALGLEHCKNSLITINKNKVNE